MNNQTRIYIAIASALALIIVGILVGAALTNYKVARLEREAAAAQSEAGRKQRQAADRELEAAGYREKIAYLERQLGEIQKLARRQDEEVEKLVIDSGRARADVERARRTRAIAATAAELCEKLAEVGHGCE